ncbi:beta-ketoacyl-[acyl-carrier-protein] synthase family protein [Desulfobacter vibrioformis]|uniref:beta-ketoacyl-[acyl-carrier-protein] synthase family protein n=1 Tax=Desulfobacter vibrioformis TaxID=34031 RepID=UPI0024805D86|nr:beta-ketoacyl-[acyl-carrier-protein] synthase family protein [Desulfobacter vibrioformis]
MKKSAPSPSCHPKRIVITGMSVISTLGDDLGAFHANLLRGKSGITAWKAPVSGCFSRIGGDMSAYDMGAKLSSLGRILPTAVFRRLGKLVHQSPRATGIGMLIAGQAFADAGLFGVKIRPERLSAILAGPYLYDLYKQANWLAFASDPDDSDVALALKEMDTDALACIMEVLGINGPCFSTGGACAAGNIALRTAMDEIRYHGSSAALVVSGFHELTPASLHSLARMGALSLDRFDAEPGRASRPFAADRNGFVPATGAAGLVIEELTHALGRGARIYAEVLGVGINTNSSRNPTPQAEPMARVMELALEEADVDKNEIDYLCAHATATPLGDLAEARAIERVFGARAGKLKINALKSMLGHQLGASALVEMVACVLQMRNGVLYPTINMERRDPEISLDVCANQCVEYRPDTVMKNAFGFGGVNSAAILRRYD